MEKKYVSTIIIVLLLQELISNNFYAMAGVMKDNTFT